MWGDLALRVGWDVTKNCTLPLPPVITSVRTWQVGLWGGEQGTRMGWWRQVRQRLDRRIDPGRQV